ncbi:ATP-binding cassette domain-containing protein [Streptomyces spectabilis]|uniref:ABC transporter ATP-binding protein n=1 Tax=Streptomyces spectabilis TaxID=68270 RepID=A0A5P2XDQ2_STRST|nr:ABC transporter ATP-binding protein [Streptomyces spectabilis]MBB5104864.1 ABC-type multidrug transport system ATPase subunit [Streptomyces spectabilis]MCI3905600.1 ABC transporter ATP-binding protein [Streptomyces spectabilis]QEV62568.1 ABC transporter ATP-binding protein [Streptomyces spectabilis]GGV07799.1 ABC transporter [Streptomyces spectabilis]
MIQAIGLTSNPRKDLPAAVDDVSFQARTGCVTALLGASDGGGTTTLRLMLELQQGRGITYFRGRPLHHIAHPSREVGVVLGDVPGHPARTVRGHLRMLCAAVGVPVTRADDVLEVVGLVSLREQVLGTLSRGMDRRLGLACALLADPHALVLDEPTGGLTAREGAWLHGVLRAHAARGGTVLFTTDDAKEAARTADQVVTLEAGRLVADQDAAEFARTRLRPRVAVRSPHAARLAALLAKEARSLRRSVEVVQEGGSRLSVYGNTCGEVGETAFRHGILVHQLADEVGDARPSTVDAREQAPVGQGRGPALDAEAGARSGSDAREGATRSATSAAGEPRESLQEAPVASTHDTAAERPPVADAAPAPGADGPTRITPSAASASQSSLSPLPPPIAIRTAPNPLRPLRYELRRAAGVGTGYLTVAAATALSALLCLFLARTGHTPQLRLLAAWPGELPLPPAALGAGLLGALAFGEEFRHPALAADRGTVPRRLGLLAAKLAVAAATALLLAGLTVGCDAVVLHLVYGGELTEVPPDWLSATASWISFMIGCAWAGVLAAGVFRSTTAGLAAVLAVPIVVVPLVQKALEGPSVRSAAGLPGRLRELTLLEWPLGAERYVAGGLRMVAQPVGSALMLSLVVLLGAYLLTAVRGRAR